MGNYDYTGKQVYIGIDVDVHKKTYVCVSEGYIVKKDWHNNPLFTQLNTLQ
jgi:hypothetical protein